MILQRPRWTSADISAFFSAGPGERVAFAPAAISPAKLAETLTALANAHGGDVLLGVTPAGKVAGVTSADEARTAVQAAGLLSTPPLILPLPQIVELDGKPICLVEVPPGLPHVYSLAGRYLTRTGRENRLLTTSELSGLLLARSEAGFESRPAPGASLADLDPAAVQSYLDALAAPAGESWQRLLLARGCLTEAADGLLPTYAGMLLFGRQPQRFVPSAEIILVRYAGPQMGDEFARHDARGALPDQIRQAEAFVNTHMRRGMRIKGFTREETAEYPISVIREAIVNAVAHRDYAIRGEGIRLLMFSDHMEVYSPGRLPGHVTLENLLSERFSRNEAIVQALSDLGFVERLGYGIDRMVAAMGEAGLPAPVFEETVAGFKVTLHGRGDELVSADPAARWGNRRLTPRQERALAHLTEHGSITNREFRDLFPDLSDETIRRELADLVDQGLIMKVGERKATYYILK
ncbi:MAG: putative DNA binding domain-containing protein [Chloroflexi bacterium]|nr:putative DNA binding domain-containing protein [Chloroflexota bacterium]